MGNDETAMQFFDVLKKKKRAKCSLLGAMLLERRDSLLTVQVHVQSQRSIPNLVSKL